MADFQHEWCFAVGTLCASAKAPLFHSSKKVGIEIRAGISDHIKPIDVGS